MASDAQTDMLLVQWTAIYQRDPNHEIRKSRYLQTLRPGRARNVTTKSPEFIDHIQALRRWCTETGNFSAVDTIDRWLAMSAEAKEALLWRWEEANREGGAK